MQDPDLGGAGKGEEEERFAVTVILDDTSALKAEEGENGRRKETSQRGRTVVTKLALGEEGIRIPRTVAVDRFWDLVLECIERAEVALGKGMAFEEGG